ncbi:hypothetical protein SS1G_06437 [Lasallia pustulata]|uniref:Retrotransposon gag domain-containing protein n=1 Tax=Lasallia pustulata TaxID=136370 RepID=A0A1W5CSS1_9LECA|nr:hypothetical protein SS1G_06437 [Lasallia pustulata]
MLKEGVVTTKALKLVALIIFTADCKKLDIFLLQLTLYFKFNQSSFTTEADTVQYASYYLQGEAKEWFRPYIQEYVKNGDNPVAAEEHIRCLFASFTRFKQEIQMVFRDINRERTAEQEVQKLKQTQSAVEYMTHFM